ncbi:MAG: glycosyltransferase [Flavobacteriales bacterium]|nr:glycosyltransferase [Flavobacteriales bacterium]
MDLFTKIILFVHLHEMNHCFKISAVICTYNREKYIRKALDALAVQTLAKSDFEIVVINNNSTDRSAEQIQEFISDHPELHIVFCNEAQQGLSHARNRGIKESTGKLITFLDDDAIAPPDFLEKCVKYFEQNPNMMALGGKIIPEFVDGKPIWYTKHYWGVTGQFDPGNQPGAILYWGKFPCGSNMTFRRDFFDTYGFFNPNLGRKGAILLAGEEKELFSRVKDKHDKDCVWYQPDLIVYHIVDNTKLNADYLKKFCLGFAKGEKLEVADAPWNVKLKRYMEYTIKPLGAMLLGLLFIIKGEKEKGHMLIRFGWWILKGMWE